MHRSKSTAFETPPLTEQSGRAAFSLRFWFSKMADALFSRDVDIKTYVAFTPAAQDALGRAIPFMADVRASLGSLLHRPVPHSLAQTFVFAPMNNPLALSRWGSRIYLVT